MPQPSTVFLLGAAWYGLLAFLLSSSLADADSVPAVVSGALLAGAFSALAIIFLRVAADLPRWSEEIEVSRSQPRLPNQDSDDQSDRSRAA